MLDIDYELQTMCIDMKTLVEKANRIRKIYIRGSRGRQKANRIYELLTQTTDIITTMISDLTPF